MAMSLIDQMKQMPGHKFRRLQQISTAIFAEELSAIDLTAVQLMALVAIEETPGIDATRLAEKIWYDRATIGEVIARLERKGFVRRRIGEQDRRTKVLEITSGGTAIVVANMPRLRRVQDRLLAGLEPTERQVLMEIVARLIDIHDRL
jgi:DNA-binding MarR family transcriptional regulator